MISLFVLPLVQLLSQPPSTSLLLERRDIIHANQQGARTLLKDIQESCLSEPSAQQLGVSTPATPTEQLQASTPVATTHGILSYFASSLQDYLHVHQDPSSLGVVWLEGMAGVTDLLSSQGSEHLVLLVAGLAIHSINRTDILKAVFKTFSGLAKALPNLVS